jgi:serine/threonine-protein kinase
VTEEAANESAEASKGSGRKRAKRRHPDIEIARLLVKRSFVRKGEAMEALKVQKQRAAEGKPRLTLVQLLVKRKVLAEDQIPDIQNQIRAHTYICTSCEARTVVVPSSTRSEAACPRCGASLSVSGPTGTLEAGAELGSGRELNFPGPPGLDRFAQGSKVFGRYQLLEEIGRGAMGVVFRARHIDLGKELAVKILLAGEDAREAQIARFRREAAAVQRLRHDGIVPIHEFGAEGEVYFLTMDLVPGALTLHKQWKDPARAPDLDTRLGQVAGVAHAIDHANARGIIHRDLKPANVLIDPSGKTLVADFGLAKDEADEAGLTLSQDRLGTPLFMAPEQVRRGSASADHRVDIWALGVMLFVAVTGRYPFRSRTIMSLYMKILHDEPDWDGQDSSSPDRDGWGRAPEPREIPELERRHEEEKESHGKDDGIPLAKKKTGAMKVTGLFDKGETKKKATPDESTEPEPHERPPPRPPFVPPPDLGGKSIPVELRAVIGMALAKDPLARYETAGALARDLERFRRGQPVKARPPGPFARFWRRAKRRRVTFFLAALLVLAPGALWLEHLRRAAKDETALKEQEKLTAEDHAHKIALEKVRADQVIQANAAADAVWGRLAVGAPSIDSFRAAARELTGVCDRYPDQPAPLVKRGLAHAYALETREAQADLESAQKKLKGQTGVSTAVARSGVLLSVLRDDAASAAAMARESLKADPRDSGMKIALARALLRLGKATEGEEALAPLLERGTDAEPLALAAELALARNDLPAAAERARLALGLAPDDTEALSAAGRVALAQGNVPAARAHLQKARDGFAARAPNEARYFLELAHNRRTDRSHRDLPGALDAGERSALLAPWSPIPIFWRADLLEKDRHDVAHALDELDRCLELDPCFDEVADLRAELLFACRDAAGLARAEKAFRREIERCDRGRAHVDLAILLIGRGDLDAARPELDHATGRMATRALLLQAEIERRTGNAEAATALVKDWSSGQGEGKDDYSRRRDLIRLARARLLEHDWKAALAALADVPESYDVRDPQWSGFQRPPTTVRVAHALRGLAAAGMGDAGMAIRELKSAGYQRRSGDRTWALVPEVTPGALATAPELEAIRGSSELEAVLGRGKQTEGED